jgi:hypothetical protein
MARPIYRRCGGTFYPFAIGPAALLTYIVWYLIDLSRRRQAPAWYGDPQPHSPHEHDGGQRWCEGREAGPEPGGLDRDPSHG